MFGPLHSPRLWLRRLYKGTGCVRSNLGNLHARHWRSKVLKGSQDSKPISWKNCSHPNHTRFWNMRTKQPCMLARTTCTEGPQAETPNMDGLATMRLQTLPDWRRFHLRVWHREHLTNGNYRQGDRLRSWCLLEDFNIWSSEASISNSLIGILARKCPQHVFCKYFGHQNGSAFHSDSAAALNIHISPAWQIQLKLWRATLLVDQISNLSRNFRLDNTLNDYNVLMWITCLVFCDKKFNSSHASDLDFFTKHWLATASKAFLKILATWTHVVRNWRNNGRGCCGLPKLVDHRTQYISWCQKA